MKMPKKRVVTLRDRRLGRGVLGIAAMAAILLCATTGQAANLLFTIVDGSVFLDIDVDFGPGFSGGEQSYHFSTILDSEHAQYIGSPPPDTNVNQPIDGSFTGTATGTPGTAGSTLQLNPGAIFNVANNGTYWPTLGVLTQTDAQFGFDSANFLVDSETTAAWAAIRGLSLDIGSVNTDTGDTVVDGGQLATWSGDDGLYFPTDFVDQASALVATSGVLDMHVAGIGIQHDLSGLPILLSFDGSTPVLGWDGAMVVLPYVVAFSQYDPELDATYTFSISGQIVATAEDLPVPEPGSMALATLGGVALAGAAWRRHRRSRL